MVFILFLSCTSTSQSKPRIHDPKASHEHWNENVGSKLDSLLRQAIEDRIIPGSVVSISIDNETVFEEAYGYAQLYGYNQQLIEHPQSMTTAHVFDLASLTKVLATTMGIMKLLDLGKVELDTGIDAYLSEFSNTDKSDITIRQLLTHTAGLSPWAPLYYHGSDAGSIVKYISNLALAYPIGRERHYSDLGFMLLGYIIESVSQESLDRFLKNNIYSPMKLQRTTFNPIQNLWSYAATSHGNPFEYKMVADDQFGYKCQEQVENFKGWRKYTLVGEVNDGNAYYAHNGIAGHAGLFSTADEIQKLLKLLCNDGLYDGQRILSKEVISEFITKDRYGNGLGWAMSTDVLPVTDLPQGGFGHTGFTGTYVLCLPDRGLSIVILTNRQNLGVNDQGSYNSLTSLRKSISDTVIQNTN